MTTILERTTGLVAFVRTIESGSFSAASRLVGSSQSAISKSVAALERRLGVKLIQRSTRTLSLTAEGQAYYERVAPLLRAIEDAEDVVQAAATARGPIRVAAPQELGRMLIAPWVATFLDRYPEVSLELGITDRFVDIIREGFDIAIRMGSHTCFMSRLRRILPRDDWSSSFLISSSQQCRSSRCMPSVASSPCGRSSSSIPWSNGSRSCR